MPLSDNNTVCGLCATYNRKAFIYGLQYRDAFDVGVDGAKMLSGAGRMRKIFFGRWRAFLHRPVLVVPKTTPCFAGGKIISYSEE